MRLPTLQHCGAEVQNISVNLAAGDENLQRGSPGLALQDGPYCDEAGGPFDERCHRFHRNDE